MTTVDATDALFDKLGLRRELKGSGSATFYDIISALRGPDLEAESALSGQLKYVFTARIRYYALAVRDALPAAIRRDLLTLSDIKFAHGTFTAHRSEISTLYIHFMRHAIEALSRLVLIYKDNDEIFALLELAEDIAYNRLRDIEKYYAVYAGTAASLSCSSCRHADYLHVNKINSCTASGWSKTLNRYEPCSCTRFATKRIKRTLEA